MGDIKIINQPHQKVNK